jgi:hypothetical protein
MSGGTKDYGNAKSLFSESQTHVCRALMAPFYAYRAAALNAMRFKVERTS